MLPFQAELSRFENSRVELTKPSGVCSSHNIEFLALNFVTWSHLEAWSSFLTWSLMSPHVYSIISHDNISNSDHVFTCSHVSTVSLSLFLSEMSSLLLLLRFTLNTWSRVHVLSLDHSSIQYDWTILIHPHTSTTSSGAGNPPTSDDTQVSWSGNSLTERGRTSFCSSSGMDERERECW